MNLDMVTPGRWLHWLGRQLTNSHDPAGYLDPLLESLNPMWLQGRIVARVEAVTEETREARTFLLRPTRRWTGFLPGQHVTLGLEIDGRRYNRTFSIASGPRLWQEKGLIRITVKRADRGKVTPWMQASLRAGDSLAISPAFGDFTLPQSPRPLLYIAGGSGITPVLSHLEHLAGAGDPRTATLIYYVRTSSEAIAWSDIEALAKDWPNLTARLICTREPDSGTPDRICAGHLAVWASDLTDRHCFLCGPGPLMDAATDLLETLGVAPAAITRAHFDVPRPLNHGRSGGTVNFLSSHRQFEARPGQNLLEAAEAAGLTPKFGCRLGVCHQCSCRKINGQVRNRITGQLSGAGEENIQICISEAQGPVSLEL